MNIRHDCDVRGGDAGQMGYFAGMIAAEFGNDYLSVGPRAEQGQRQSYLVVKTLR